MSSKPPIAPLANNQDNKNQEQEQGLETPSFSAKPRNNNQLIIGVLIGVVLTTIATTFMNRNPESDTATNANSPEPNELATISSSVKQAITTSIRH